MSDDDLSFNTQTCINLRGTGCWRRGRLGPFLSAIPCHLASAIPTPGLIDVVRMNDNNNARSTIRLVLELAACNAFLESPVLSAMALLIARTWSESLND
jgi:hypothetical protein